MKKLLIVGAIIAVVAWSIFALSRTETVKNISGLSGKMETALTVWEKIEEYAAYCAYEIDMLKAQLKESDKKIDSLTGLVSGYATTIANINQQISELPTYELPPISTVEPEDFEQCLEELSISRKASGQLMEIVEGQQQHIALLESKSLNQQLIIDTQAQTIAIQQADNQALREAYDDMIRDANRRKWVGYVIGLLGIAVAVL